MLDQKEDNVGFWFDMFLFENELSSEWGKFPMDKVCIGLYAGYGGNSTETFKLQLNVNKTIVGSDSQDILQIMDLNINLAWKKITRRSINNFFYHIGVLSILL